MIGRIETVNLKVLITPILPTLVLCCAASYVHDDLEPKISAVLPTAEEDAFLKIPWRLNILQARTESARTGKPLFVWSMNGHPLGHT